MKIKKIIIFVIILVLTGCSATVNISVDKDLKITENDVISFDNISTPSGSMKSYISSFISYYDSTISFKGYSYEIDEGGSKSKVTFNKTSDNMCDLIHAGLFTNQLYDNVECIEDELYITVRSVGNNSFSKSQSEKEFDVDDVKINITLPVKAIESNADDINKTKYTWNYDKTTTGDKSLYFKISKNTLNKEKENIKKRKAITSNVKKIAIVLALVGIIVFIAIMSKILYDKYKANRIEY